MTAPPRSVLDLLRRLERDRLCKVDPGLALAIEEILRAGSHDTPEALAAAIASLCARDPRKWSIIHRRARDYLADPGERESPVEKILKDEPRPAGRRWVMPALLILALGVVGGGVAALASMYGPEDRFERDSEAAAIARTTTAEELATTGATTEPTAGVKAPEATGDAVNPAAGEAEGAEVRDLAPRPPVAGPAGRVIGLALLLSVSLAFVVLGVRLLFAPALRRLLAEMQRKRVLAESQGVRALYSVQRHLPFAAAVVDAAADVLARRRVAGLGAYLDIPATIDATVRAGGRVVPRMEPGPAPQGLVVLVALQGGDHSMLDPVEAILDRWREAGLTFRRYDFHHQIESLRDPIDRTSITLDLLSRRAEGRPLLIFARSTLLASKAGAQGWLHRLRAWPTRALVELDPRADHELEELEGGFRRAIDATDLRRFPFTARGLDAMARYLGSEGRITLSVPEEPLPSLSAIAPQIRRWAHCLACVPDPSWRQLEAFRRDFADTFFGGRLGDPRVIERLVEWLRADLARRGYEGSGVKGSGSGVDVGEEPTRRYLEELWSSDVEHALEDACHRVLLRQLRAAQPRALLDRLHNRAKIYEHELLLAARDPAGAAVALVRFDEFIGTPAEDFARAILERHAARFAAVEDAPAGLAGLQGEIRRFYDRPLAPVEALCDPHGWRATAPELALGSAAVAGNALALVGAVGGGDAWLAVGVVIEVGALARLALHFIRRREGRGRPNSRSRSTAWRPGALEDEPTGRVRGVRHTVFAGVAPMGFVELTGGEFTMGSRDDDATAYDGERPRHRVRVGRFWIAEAPVTQAQYEALMGVNPSVDKGPEVPVNNVSWEDAVRFCNAISKREGRQVCYREEGGGWRWDRRADGYRLPTEAEWEYACRAGTKSAYSFGDDPAALGKYAWFDENSKGDAQPVKRKRPNPWGLHDMHGNVWEWCWDWYGPYSNEPSDMPQGPDSGEDRVLRGGSFDYSARNLRSALRHRVRPSNRYWYYGFRCVRSSPSSVDP